MSADKAPAEKLPLAVRKNVRDGWENKRADLEAQLATLLGVPWTFDINPLLIYPYAEEDSYGHHSLGDCIYAYIEGFIYRLKYFLEAHSDAGKEELNSVCSTHSITLIPSTAFTYCGVDIDSGVLRLHFHPNCLGTNINNAAENLANAISIAPQPEGAPTLSFTARASVKTEYDPKIAEILKKCQELLQNPKLAFEPGFEDLGKGLKGGKDVRDDWETNLGDFARRYFESFKDVIEREGFGTDDLLREGFEEGVPKGVVKLRVVGELKSGYNETLVEDGELVIQTTAGNWGTNIHYAAEKLVDLL